MGSWEDALASRMVIPDTREANALMLTRALRFPEVVGQFLDNPDVYMTEDGNLWVPDELWDEWVEKYG